MSTQQRWQSAVDRVREIMTRELDGPVLHENLKTLDAYKKHVPPGLAEGTEDDMVCRLLCKMPGSLDDLLEIEPITVHGVTPMLHTLAIEVRALKRQLASVATPWDARLQAS